MQNLIFWMMKRDACLQDSMPNSCNSMTSSLAQGPLGGLARYATKCACAPGGLVGSQRHDRSGLGGSCPRAWLGPAHAPPLGPLQSIPTVRPTQTGVLYYVVIGRQHQILKLMSAAG